ncbi:hypothetical protein UFOVP729_43 [uncultured Caudovirales phage]|uniref:Uncharacterized protein n=1 Tax=uncultured Caudovirales phage TaxID=2100421 RepID=A0A6J5NPP9_9CAUD|nr:hypothetical protein UFOVP729_43 [uncultured Caudovirales phage]
MELYQDGETPEEQQPLYTAADTQPEVDTTRGNYSVVKGIATVATGQTPADGNVDFDSVVDTAWRLTVPKNNAVDYDIAQDAAARSDGNVVQQMLANVAERNRMYGEIASKNADATRKKLKELTDTAVENTVIKNPAVLFNNTPQQISESNERVSARLAASATLEKAIKDGQSLWNIIPGLGYEILPMAAEQGAAIDRVAIKYGVPADSISRTSGRSVTKSYLQVVFNSLPDEEKGKWLDGLYKDLKDSWLITDWQAALLVKEVATNEEQTWDGLSDWLDRLGVVGTAVAGTAAVLKAGKLLKSANAINNVERTIAAGGGKSAIVSAEGAKITSEVANRMRLQAVGVVAGELTGISTAIDLGKLVSVNAAKVLPDVITTAADDLQKLIRQPVDRLINELQDVIAAKGVRAEEAAVELALLERTYSKANNPNVHSVDPFKLSEDGLVITGKVYYKPENASAFLTKEAAEAYIKVVDPSGKMGMKVVGDTTNTNFLVEESVKKDLQLRKAELEALILEEINATKPKPPTGGGKVDVGTLDIKTPKELDLSKPRWKTAGLVFESDVDKAAYQVGSKTKPSKSDLVIKEWLQKSTGWDDAEIKAHAQRVRNYIKENEDVALDDVGNILVANNYNGPRASASAAVSPEVQKQYDTAFKIFEAEAGLVRIGNLALSQNTQKGFIAEFVGKLAPALGMQNRKVIVMQYSDLKKSKTPYLKEFARVFDKNHPTAAATHSNFGNGQSLIIMRTQVSPTSNLRYYMETFAHEYGHAFDAEFNGKYFATMQNAFNDWLKSKGLKYAGQAKYQKVIDAYPPEMLIEYRNLTMGKQLLDDFVQKWFQGDKAGFDVAEANLHGWANSYAEFFAEQFSKWAFTDEVPTTILGQAFAKLVEGFKMIAAELNTRLSQLLGREIDVATADKNITKMLNDHIKMYRDEVVATRASAPNIASESKDIKPSLENLEKQLEEVVAELNAIEDAEKGLKTGYVVEQPINRTLDYSLIGKYTDDDINSAARFAMGDWALSTSKELYGQRVVGIAQQSRYQKLLTNFVRPSLEKLNKSEMVALNDALVLGDKEGKVFQQNELAGMGLSANAREGYYKVRALRDVMWQIRNDAAARSLTRRGYVELTSDIKLTDDSKLFVKPRAVVEGDTVYLADSQSATRVTSKFLEENQTKGYTFYEVVEPVEIEGKMRRIIGFPDGSYQTNRISNVIPYRAGEYRRIYSDEYFVKIKSVYEVDGKMEEVVQTHRTAASLAEANAYVKALNEAKALHAAGNLTIAEASRLMEPYGWRPEEIIAALDSNRFGQSFSVNVLYTRTDDDYIAETIGMSSNYSSKRGDKVLSVFGKDTVNTLSPLDSVAAEIGNTAYVASITEWRESHVVRWFNTFVDDLPDNVRTMTPDAAFRYMLNNKGMYIGTSKRLATAEKVQEYIIAQMNIPTKEEKQYLGFMRMISESLESKTGSKPIAKLGATLRATKDYPTWARTIAFHSFFAFNPVQFFMQGMNAFNAIAISPLHGIKSAKSSSLYSLALFSDQEDIWRNVAKVNNLTNLGLGMKEDEFVEVVRAIRRTGLMDGINTTSLYGAEVGKYGIFNKVSRRAGDTSAAFFNAGEGYSRLVSFDIARREYIDANPGTAWWTDDALAKIIERQDSLTQNMTRANTASWQQGWKSIPTQFVQYQVKLMMNIIQSLMGNPRAFTQKEAAQLLLTHTLVMGTAGAFLWPFRDILTDMLPEDMSETQRITVQQGVVAGAIAALTDGEAKLAIGSRFNTFKYYEDIVKGLLDPEKTFLEVAAGPSGFASLRLLGGFGEAFSIIAKAPMTVDTLQIALTEIGKGSFSFINNAQKARIAMANYNQVQSGSGASMFRVTDTEAWLIGFGIPPVAQEDLSVLYSSKKAHDEDIKSAAKAVGKHAMLGLTALRNNDTEGHRTHSAVVHAILNSYSGADLQQLYREAYKVEAFTQYEKMLTDQAVKDWKIKDIVTNTGATE